MDHQHQRTLSSGHGAAVRFIHKVTSCEPELKTHTITPRKSLHFTCLRGSTATHLHSLSFSLARATTATTAIAPLLLHNTQRCLLICSCVCVCALVFFVNAFFEARSLFWVHPRKREQESASTGGRTGCLLSHSSLLFSSPSAVFLLLLLLFGSASARSVDCLLLLLLLL